MFAEGPDDNIPSVEDERPGLCEVISAVPGRNVDDTLIDTSDWDAGIIPEMSCPWYWYQPAW